MLVLTRKTTEQILIGDNIKITIVRVQGNSVRIGIDAPREMRVVRGELAPLEGDEPSVELSDRDEVFAHPQPQPHRVGRVKESADSSVSRPKLFVGQVGRDGGNPRLRRAPLAGFMSAT